MLADPDEVIAKVFDPAEGWVATHALALPAGRTGHVVAALDAQAAALPARRFRWENPVCSS